MKYNFGAGPSALPSEVLQKSSQAVIELDNTGLSILEISHRSKEFQAIFERTRSLIKELMSLGNEFEILLLQGGALLQFSAVPYNFMRVNHTADYLDTGIWASKALNEAKRFGTVQVVASSKNTNYNSIPEHYTISPNAEYFHCTSNNTIYGTQIKNFPQSPVPMVCDMSSDILSRQLDFNTFDLIYAGAQKNLGSAGTTMVAVKKNIIGQSQRNIPAYLDYAMHIKADGMLNTPPVFSIYTIMLFLEWLQKKGGIAGIEKENKIKATLLYNEIDSNPLFNGHALPEYRSDMNVTFNLEGEALKTEFDALCKQASIVGINGHRSVGGYRASIYNAVPLSHVEVLVDVMKNFTKKNG